MKRALLFSLLLVPGFESCTHQPVTAVQPELTAPLSGERIISYFNHDDTDMTHHLDGYTFDFQSGGTLAVNTGTQLLNGTWDQQWDDDHVAFTINIPDADFMLEEINEDFTLVENSETMLALVHNHTDHHMEVNFKIQ